MAELEKKKETPKGPDGEVCRDLICAEEWKDPETRKVLTEYHKEGLPEELAAGVDADLETFEQYWKKKGGAVKVKGEYHKDGAPFLDRDPGWDKMDKSASVASDDAENSPNEVAEGGLDEKAAEIPKPGPEAARTQNPEDGPPQGTIQRPINFGMIEMASYALLRVAFPNGISIPIKRDGMVDMDVTIKGKEVTFNTNQLFFSVPELNVWHVVYQHKGKPILELGRGVKNGMKIHRLAAIRMGLEMWNGSRKMNKLRLKQLKEADKKQHQEAVK